MTNKPATIAAILALLSACPAETEETCLLCVERCAPLAVVRCYTGTTLRGATLRVSCVCERADR